MWDDLPFDQWEDTLDTLHMWMQIVGKVKLELAPFLNHWWEVAFLTTANGLTTGPIPYGLELLQIDFNFTGSNSHSMVIKTSWQNEIVVELQPQTVADFYNKFFDLLAGAGIDISIWPVPVEIQDSIPFPKDKQHKSYDKAYVERWWQIMMKSSIVFDQFRSSYRGKNSPTQFYWGSFDICGARYSGKPAKPPKLTGVMGKIMRYSENAENFCYGFWPGNKNYPHPAYYAYIYPQPKGIEQIRFHGKPLFDKQLGEFILPYDYVRLAEHPDRKLLEFLESAYAQSAKLAGWDVSSLQNQVPLKI